MPQEKKFLTARGYELMDKQLRGFTASMEDYMEMIYRLGQGEGIRTSDLAEALNVNRSSVTKMIQKLDAKGLVEYERYGVIRLTTDGLRLGKYLNERHNIITEFLRLLGVSQNLLKDVERIEHNISPGTLKHITDLIEFVRLRPEWWEEYSRAAGLRDIP